MRQSVVMMRFGAQLVEPGRTRFRLWAPGADEAELAVEGAAAIPMERLEGGWFAVDADAGAGTAYRYRFPGLGGLVAPDPASRAQAEDVHGPSLIVDPASYRWQTEGWRGRPWHEAVVYECHVGLMGGFAGLTGKLLALAELGITAVELMPVADFPGPRNWGYDGVLPYAPDRAYGTPDELKALVDRAHSLGLMMILDVVYNHFGPDGNYLHAYAPQFFDEGQHTPWGAAIDFHKPEVRAFFTENALMWLDDYRFDGLRMDAVHAICDPGWLDELGATVRAHLPGRHVHLVLENERNEPSHLGRDIDAQWNDDVHHCLHVMLTGEDAGYYKGYSDAPAAKLARGLSEGFVYQGEVMPYGEHKPRGAPSAHLPVTAFVDCLQNHDQVGNRALGDRLTTLADGRALEAAVALLLLSPHIPMIFMGEETGSKAPFLFFTSFEGELADAVREGRRREFAAFPAFADPEKREAIPDPNGLETFERSRPVVAGEETTADERAWSDLYRQLLALRRDAITPRLEGTTSLGADAIADRAVLARWRMGDNHVLTIAFNLGEEPVEAELPSAPPLWGEAEPGAVPPRTTLAWMTPVEIAEPDQPQLAGAAAGTAEPTAP